MPRQKRVGITVTKQRHDWDCGVAALAMLLGKPYGDVAVIVRDLVDPIKLKKRGTIIADLALIADSFGISLKPIWRKTNYLVNQTGILGMLGGQMDKAGHWVVLKEGKVIVDPDDGSVWSVEDYTKRFGCRTVTLLVIDK
jgi:ABC-type bacteriocin/lantibiotic exporter with double-glycine peptidase domain